MNSYAYASDDSKEIDMHIWMCSDSSHNNFTLNHEEMDKMNDVMIEAEHRAIWTWKRWKYTKNKRTHTNEINLMHKINTHS